MWAMTRTGISCAYSTAASQVPRAMNLSISSLAIARARGSILFMASGVNGGSSTMRAGRCSGGSEVMGGAGTRGGGVSRTITRREEKCSVS